MRTRPADPDEVRRLTLAAFAAGDLDELMARRTTGRGGTGTAEAKAEQHAIIELLREVADN